MSYTTEEHKKVAQKMPRDAKGHFISKNKASSISKGEKYSDDLLDVRVHNPLKRITDLLEDIKKQKAFAFTLKGSLGVMGVFLALSVFGIFGGGKMLCDKGVQSLIGTIKILQVTQTEGRHIPILSNLISYLKNESNQPHPRTLLVKQDGTAINLPPSRFVDLVPFQNYSVIATGDYDACGQTLKVTDPAAVEFFFSFHN